MLHTKCTVSNSNSLFQVKICYDGQYTRHITNRSDLQVLYVENAAELEIAPWDYSLPCLDYCAAQHQQQLVHLWVKARLMQSCLVCLSSQTCGSRNRTSIYTSGFFSSHQIKRKIEITVKPLVKVLFWDPKSAWWRCTIQVNIWKIIYLNCRERYRPLQKVKMWSLLVVGSITKQGPIAKKTKFWAYPSSKL